MEQLCNDPIMDWLCFLIISGFFAIILPHYAKSLDKQTLATFTGLSLLFFVSAGIPYSAAAMVLGLYFGWALLQQPSVQISTSVVLVMAATMAAELVFGIIDCLQLTCASVQLSSRATRAHENLLDSLQGISHIGIFPIVFQSSLL